MNLTVNLERIKNIFLTLYVTLYLFASFILLFITGEAKNLYVIILLAGGILVSLFMLANKNKISSKKYVKLILIICFYYMLVQIINSRSPYSVLYPLNAFFLGYVVSVKNLDLRILYIELLIVSGILFYFMINAYNPNTIFENSSRNLISVVLLYTSLLIYFQEYKLAKRLTLFPAVVTLVFSIWAIGRSGIICSIILLSIVVYYHFKKNNLYSKLFFLLFSFLLFFWAIKNSMEFLDLFIRFEERGLSYEDDERNVMFELYSSNINPSTFFFGYNYFSDSRFVKWDFNVHNSFISCHALWGIGSIFFFIKLIKKSISSFKKRRILLSLILLFLLRAFSDAIAFNGMYDFILISMMFYLYSNYSNECLQD